MDSRALKSQDMDYVKIEKYITGLIRQNKLKAGDRLIPETHIAKMFNVSRIPVRNALKRLMNQGVLQKVKGQGTFVRRGAETPKVTNKLGILHCHSKEGFFHSSFYTAILAGIESEARDFRKMLILHSISPDQEEDPNVTLQLLEPETDGLILVDLAPSVLSRVRAMLERYPKPVVVLNYEKLPDTIDSVVFDSQENARRVVQFLVDLGHRRILYFTPPPMFGDPIHPNFENRIRAYTEVMAGSGLDYGEKLAAQNRIPREMEALASLLRGPDRPTALFCLGDDIAVRVYGLARDLGIRIPEDLTVVGCDDIREAPRLQPPLTTVHTPLVQMGKTGVKRLLEKMKEQQQGVVTHYRITLPGSMAQRGSHQKTTL